MQGQKKLSELSSSVTHGEIRNETKQEVEETRHAREWLLCHHAQIGLIMCIAMDLLSVFLTLNIDA